MITPVVITHRETVPVADSPPYDEVPGLVRVHRFHFRDEDRFDGFLDLAETEESRFYAVFLDRDALFDDENEGLAFLMDEAGLKLTGNISD